MQAFTAKGLKEKWVITHNGNILDKIISKTTKHAAIRKHTTTTYLQGGKALPAFHAEKKKALAKGLEISNFDSTVKKPNVSQLLSKVYGEKVKKPEIYPYVGEVETVVRPKMVKVMGYSVPVEG